ncbi:GxxExxY protein [Geothrix fuzhouensis]|uniref:GxxExxY protein n=1 Tax=Geothrix fuzhouensis TaxID=2966451 RepID=UPI002147B6AD|nr:GxxExxY protein [Geothrix fuzhouensis]
MNTDQEKGLRPDHDPLTEIVIGLVFKVANGLGSGFLEKVYENALAIELQRAGLTFQQQVPITVSYAGQVVGTYIADLVVEGRLLLELKACRALEDAHTAQSLNYLKATDLPTCLLVNFGIPKPQIKRLSR